VAQFIIGNVLGKSAEKHRGLQKLLWRIDFAAVWLLIKLFALLPTDLASSLGGRLGRLIGPRLKRKNEMYRENLSRAFPHKNEDEIQQLVLKSWFSAGRVLAEYPHISAILESKDRQRVHIELSEEFRASLQDQRPTVFVGAHTSNWEMVMPALSRLGVPLAALYSPPTNPLLNQMLYNSRKEMNCELVARDSAARDMMRHLKKGRSTGLIVDRRIDGGPDVSFFGLPKPSSLLPAKLALKYNINLVPGRVQRLHGAEFKVTFYPPIEVDIEIGDEDARALDMMNKVHEHFEQWILEEPEEWFCPKRIWPKHAVRLNPDNAHTEANHYAS
jgi:Kdo2-lipid IVA lauroyltransferase/acyltransferase